MSESAELRILRAELAALTIRVEELSTQVIALETEVAIDRSFELVGQESAGSAAAASERTGYSSQTPSRAPVAGHSGSLTLADREKICVKIGEHIARSLAGTHRGESGRKELKLASRLYLIFKNIEGVVYNPCRILHKWSEVKVECERSGSFGDSVFIGLPSLFDARIVCRAAGVALPQ